MNPEGMARGSWLAILILLVPLALLSAPQHVTSSNVQSSFDHGVHVVYMGGKSGKHEDQIVAEHHDLLASVVGSVEVAREAILYHYHRTFRGFAAKLASHHVEALKGCQGVHSVIKSRSHKLTTTRSWKFLGVDSSSANVNPGIAKCSQPFPSFRRQSDVIIGVLDTGYWPESKSFGDQGMGPPPVRWKGECVAGDNFTSHLCNNKVIGARFYHKNADAILQALYNLTRIPGELYSARGAQGHGTHTASIAAGRSVANESFFGLQLGTVTGGAPGARIAVYKVCWAVVGCGDADILKAYDDAVGDGVDIISFSIGPNSPISNVSILEDPMSLGALHAALKGVLTSASGGNDGPGPSTIMNTAPWFFTVAASSIDRELVTQLQLGNGITLPGQWFTVVSVCRAYIPLVLSTQAAAAGKNAGEAKFCRNGSLDVSKMEGRVLVCYIPSDSTGSGDSLRDYFKELNVTQASGIIFIGSPGSPVSADQPTPTSGSRFLTVITKESGHTLVDYIHSTPAPVVRVETTTSVNGIKPAPIVASFSSRGPSPNTDIIKPDITAPGISILAAWSPLEFNTTLGVPVDYNIESGTSMACPHVTGIAALIKAVHPNWSPSAIKSAMMTTAYVVDNTNSSIRAYPHLQPADEYAYGSGHVNPASALDPGLVYETHAKDYLDYLCSSENVTVLRSFFQDPAEAEYIDHFSCPKKPMKPSDLNYPSILVAACGTQEETVRRVVTNVGPVGQVNYTSYVVAPKGLKVSVKPQRLQFKEVGEELEFFIQLKRVQRTTSSDILRGSITWTDGKHKVRSPIVVTQHEDS